MLHQVQVAGVAEDLNLSRAQSPDLDGQHDGEDQGHQADPRGRQRHDALDRGQLRPRAGD
ncbi:MAG: hypothetical protein WKF40_11225 [Thermoleophilaceae bacterium]